MNSIDPRATARETAAQAVDSLCDTLIAIRGKIDTLQIALARQKEMLAISESALTAAQKLVDSFDDPA